MTLTAISPTEAAVNHFSFSFQGGVISLTDDDDYNGGGACGDGQPAVYLAPTGAVEGCWHAMSGGIILVDFNDYAMLFPVQSVKKQKDS
jgi:hypothetical protein